jgi:hypothetical protein
MHAWAQRRHFQKHNYGWHICIEMQLYIFQSFSCIVIFIIIHIIPYNTYIHIMWLDWLSDYTYLSKGYWSWVFQALRGEKDNLIH